MKFMRVVTLCAVLAATLALAGASPAAATVVNIEIEITQIGYDLPGNDCANPQSSRTIDSGDALELCFEFEVSSPSEALVLTEVSFGPTEGAEAAMVPGFTRTYESGTNSYTDIVSDSIAIPDGDVYFDLQDWVARVTFDDYVPIANKVEVSTALITTPSVAYDSSTLHVDLNPPTMTKTVSTDGTCGTENTATVITNTAVTYCYSIVNPSSTVTIGVHYLDDDKLGTDLVGAPHIYPGTTFTHLETQPLVETVTNVATACVQWVMPREIEPTSVSGISQEVEGCAWDEITANATVTVEDPNPTEVPTEIPTQVPTEVPTPGSEVLGFDELAFTGSNTAPFAVLGFTAMFAGLIMLAAVRRREN